MAAGQQIEVKQDGITNDWSPFEGINVETTLRVFNKGYTVRHVVTSDIACTAYCCGFAVSRDGSDYRAATSQDTVDILSDGSGCEVYGGQGIIINASPNTNLLFPRTAIPAVQHVIGVGTTEIRDSITIFP